MLELRIVSADYYMSPPMKGFDVTYSHFRGFVVKQVPIIRIFGTTTEGELNFVLLSLSDLKMWNYSILF